LNDIFAVQEAIATDVVRQLEPKLVDTSLQVTPHDPEAYSLLLQGNYLSNDPDKQRLKDSIQLYEKALGIEPGLADAWFGIADAYDTLGTIGAMPSSEAQRLASEAAQLGAAIEPESGRGQLLLGWTLFNYEADYAEAARRFDRAISLAPTDARTVEFVSSFLATLGRLEPAIGLMQYAVSRDPVDAIAHNNLGVLQRWNGQTENARKSLSTALKLLPEFSGAEYEIGLTYIQDEQPGRALEHFKKESSEPFGLVGTVMALHALGSYEEANSVADELIQKYGDYVGFYIAQAEAFRNKNDSAFEWLRKAMKDGNHGLSTANVEPMLENLHGDPRWLPLLRELGTSSEQLAVIEFDLPATLIPAR
jgi:tetratricopeptide (TPR) repeat protein